MVRVVLCALVALSLAGCATAGADEAAMKAAAGASAPPPASLEERMRETAEALKAAYRAYMIVLDEDARAKAAAYAGAQTLEQQAAGALQVAKERTKALKAAAETAARKLADCKANETKCVPDTSGSSGGDGSPKAR